MWERIKMWLGWHHSSQLSRFDAAATANLDAQRKLQEAGDEAADAAAAARKRAILARWEARTAEVAP